MNKMREHGVIGLAWVYWVGMTMATRVEELGQIFSVWMPVITGIPVAVYTWIKIFVWCKAHLRRQPRCAHQAQCDKYVEQLKGNA